MPVLSVLRYKIEKDEGLSISYTEYHHAFETTESQSKKTVMPHVPWKEIHSKKHVAREVRGLLSLLHIFNWLLYMQNLL